MLQYIINSAICLFALWICYKILLENTSWHRFKRFYLLGAIIAAALIPLIVVKTTVIPITTLPIDYQAIPNTVDVNIIDTTVPVESSFNWWNLVLGIYLLGVLVMLYRFVKNLMNLQIKPTDELNNYANYQLVLRNVITLPHSFINRIFIGKKEYQQQQIPIEVLEHEKAHLDQKHSWDILIIEVLLVLLWFHPLLYLLKYSIKLNHEFLADKAVIEQGKDTTAYQELLLAYSHTMTSKRLAHTFNFPIIKKRFQIMNTQTSKATGILRTLVLLPIITLLVIACGKENEIEEVQEITNNDFYKDAMPFALADTTPLFPKCQHLETKDEIKKCSSSKITEIVADNFDKTIAERLNISDDIKIETQFKINTKGVIEAIQVKAPHPEFEKEAHRVLKLIPTLLPATHDSKPVSVIYALPIIFKGENNTQTSSNISYPEEFKNKPPLEEYKALVQFHKELKDKTGKLLMIYNYTDRMAELYNQLSPQHQLEWPLNSEPGVMPVKKDKISKEAYKEMTQWLEDTYDNGNSDTITMIRDFTKKEESYSIEVADTGKVYFQNQEVDYNDIKNFINEIAPNNKSNIYVFMADVDFKKYSMKRKPNDIYLYVKAKDYDPSNNEIAEFFIDQGRIPIELAMEHQATKKTTIKLGKYLKSIGVTNVNI